MVYKKMPSKLPDSSGSDWDSIVVPPEAPLQTPTSPKDEKKTTPESNDPPLDFRTEVTKSTTTPERKKDKPGKPRRSLTYEHSASFDSSHDSADDQPVYARVQRKKAPTNQRSENPMKSKKNTPPESDSDCAPTPPVPSPRVRTVQKLTLPRTLSSLHLSRKSTEPLKQNGHSVVEMDIKTASDGLVNEAFEAEEDAPTQYPDMTGRAQERKKLHRDEETLYLQTFKTKNDVASNLETAVDKMLTISCLWVAIPFRFTALLLHHLIRLILLRIFKPLLLDSVTLIIDLLFRPVVGSVLKPLMSSLSVALEKVNEECSVFCNFEFRVTTRYFSS
ncbi:hypothetical protein FHG87_005259 [Trinorchestia longiramus]|nr:hypothetical protein FHG87_005259 [Trinorchestia longiramus]